MTDALRTIAAILFTLIAVCAVTAWGRDQQRRRWIRKIERQQARQQMSAWRQAQQRRIATGELHQAQHERRTAQEAEAAWRSRVQ